MTPPLIASPAEIVVVTPYRMFDATLTSLCKDAFKPELRVHFQADSTALGELPEPPDLLILLGTELMNIGNSTLARLAAGDTKIVALCADTSAQAIRRYISMGIRGIVHASRSGNDMIEVLRFVWKGGTYISSEFWASDDGRKTGVGHGDSRRPAFRGRLTTRQRTILELVRTGASNKHIARQLAIAESTVKTHLHLIMRIVGVRCRAELIALTRAESD